MKKSGLTIVGSTTFIVTFRMHFHDMPLVMCDASVPVVDLLIDGLFARACMQEKACSSPTPVLLWLVWISLDFCLFGYDIYP